MTDEESLLPPFPVDDATLGAVEHALGYYLEFDEEAERDGNDFPFKGAGAEYTLSALLDFMAGCTGDEGVRTLPEHEWINGIETTIDERPHYTEHDVIRALIEEVRRLRSE